MAHLLASAISSAIFAVFFLAFSLSLDFWGRLLLRALKAGDAAEPDGMLPCLSAAAGVMAICRWLSFFTHAFEIPFAVFVAVGVLGAAWDIAKPLLPGSRALGEIAPGPHVPALRKIFGGREWAAVATLLCFALGFWFCRLWPSSGLEPWFTSSVDYYSWIFHAGYWMGYTDADTYGIAYQHPWIFDAFGTNILFAMFSSARGEPAWLASPGFTVLLLAWSGCAIYGLVRRLAGFPRWLSWISAMGVVCGWFFLLLSFYGLYGQLTATFGFLLLMRSALGGMKSAPSRRAGMARLFFPLLYIFLTYQAGYLMFASIAAAAAFLRMRFEAANPGAGGPAAESGHARNGDRGFLAGALKDTWSAAWPVIAATAVAAAVVPQAAAQVALRTVSAAIQTSGYGLHLLDPGLFAGFPLIAEGGNFGVMAGVSGLEWAVFLASFGALCLISLRRRMAAFPGRDLEGMRTMALLFVLFLGAYLFAFAWKGDDYRIWKFVSLTALPLSFTPAALLVSSVFAVFRGNWRRTLAACAMMAAVAAAPQVMYRDPLGPRAAIQDMRSLLPLAEAVQAALEYDRDRQLVLFDFLTMERAFAALVVSQYSGVYRVAAVFPNYFGSFVPNYFKMAERGAPVYSDRVYPALFKGNNAATPREFTVFRYDMDIMRKGGAVSFTGFEAYTRRPNRRIARIRILPPERLLGRDLVVRITFARGLDGLDPSCGRPTAREALAAPDEAVGREGGEFLVPAPAGWQKGGYIELLLDFPDLPPIPRHDGAAWDPKHAPPVCGFSVDAVELFPREAAREDAEGSVSEPVS
ncbi:MAG: hypothetical protein LBR80_01990 [Deltaproteobacteria bacterium]|nr:hypothetical protein [Deltaproteobacteria bacterium]